MAIQGLRTTANFVTDQRPKNWRETIMLLYPNGGKTPLTGLTSLMKSRKVDDPEFSWWEKELSARRVALSASITTGSLALSVTSGALQFKAGDVLWSEENSEKVLVTADPSSDTSIPVMRGFAGSTPAAITYNGNGVNPNWLCIGSANEEGSDAPTGVNFDPTKKYNYTQIFRNALEATRTAIKTRLRTGDQVKEAKRECLELHGIDMERAFILGSRYEGTRNGKPLHTTGGIVSFIDSANVKVATTDYPSGVTMAALEGYLKAMFAYGSSEKLGFCGNTALLTIQQIIRKNTQGTWELRTGLNEYGMNVSRLICPFGELVLKPHPLFNQVTGGTTGNAAYYGMDSWLLVLDMASIGYVYIDDTTYEPDVGAKGIDGQKSAYLTEAGIEVFHPKTHYLIKNLVLAAKDA